MLLPRYSLRWILAINAVFALVFLVASYARSGQSWAIGLLGTLIAGAVSMLLFATLFAITFLFSRFVRATQRVRTESPFATDKLPPQIIPPRDVE